MTEDDCRRAVAIARKATAGWPLSYEDRQDVEQDACIAAWLHGLEASTRVFYSARDSAQKLQGKGRWTRPIIVSLDEDEGWAAMVRRRQRSSDNVEDEVIGQFEIDRLLATLHPGARYVIEETVLKERPQADVGLETGVGDDAICKRRQNALKKMRQVT